ncbi:MAG TPA: WYL domain-containing protein [Candidatus Desulfobacillus sp.]|nr:WYL domain-containing protein [Candidatus Desulfobacillus sp.]
MPLNERIYLIENLLKNRGVVPFSLMQERTEASRATINRDLQFMRDRLRIPIVFDKNLGGYRLDGGGRPVQTELPGLWFNDAEIHALLTMQQLISGLDRGGLLGVHLKPLMARLKELLGSADNSASEVQKRVRVLGVQARHLPLEHFAAVGSALLRRKRLQIGYRARYNDQASEREVSPQRLVYYRDNWYLDGWCHLRGAIRSFAVDAIERIEILERRAKDVPEKELDEVLGAGYGIFSGKDVKWAKLRFTPDRARWVASERWHSRQKGSFEPNGSYLLEVPFSHPQELMMDILRHGAAVEVLGPESLRKQVEAEAVAIADRYAEGAR